MFAASPASSNVVVATVVIATSVFVDVLRSTWYVWAPVEPVSLVHEDVILSMPPYALWLEGKYDMLEFLTGRASHCEGNVHIPVEVNASAGLAFYQPTRSGDTFEPFSIQVIDLVGPTITAIHNFLDVRLFERFGLPSAPVASRTLAALASGPRNSV